MQNETGVFNLALSLCGHRSSVASPSELSREAEICRLWFPVVTDMVLASAHWASARRFARLALLAEQSAEWDLDQPDPRFRFAYALPNDCLHPRFMHDYSVFALGTHKSGTAVMTHHTAPILAYTFRNTAIGTWEPALYNAIAHVLAGYIVMPLSGKLERMRTLRTLAVEILSEARVFNANADDYQNDVVPDELSYRGAGQLIGPARFIYPTQSIGFAPA